MKPTTEQMRVVIADRHGFREIHQHTEGLRGYIDNHPFKWSPWPDETFGVPHYDTDLNAMHEAEKVLEPDMVGSEGFNKHGSDWKWPIYCNHLHNIGRRDNIGSNIHSTALQRAEAFCRTIKPELFK